MELHVDAMLTANPAGLARWNYKGRHIVDVTLVATDTSGLNTSTALDSVCVVPDGQTLATPAPLRLRLEEMGNRPFVTITVSHLAQPLGKGYQQLGTSVFHLSASDFRTLSTDGELVKTSPWSSPDENQAYGFSFDYPPIVVGEGTIVVRRVTRDTDDPPSEQQLELADTTTANEHEVIKSIQCEMEKGAVGPNYNGCFGKQYIYKLHDAGASPPGLHANWVTRPNHCAVHPRGLESLLEIACMMERITPRDFLRMCNEDPHSAMGVVALAAQIVANSIQYQVDTDLTGSTSDLCMDPRWMIASMRCAGEGSDMARADCEDLANIGIQIVVAFQTSTPDTDLPLLMAAKEVSGAYTAVFLYCTVTTKRTNSAEAKRLERESSESATWWPESTIEIAAREDWDNTSVAHITCVCFRNDVLQGMIDRAGTGKIGNTPAPHGHLIEGTGMQHSRGQRDARLEKECFEWMSRARGDIDPDLTDFTPMVDQETQPFYRMGMQVIYGGTSYMLEDPVTGVRGMPMGRMLRHPEQVALVSDGPPITDPAKLGCVYRKMAHMYPDLSIGNGIPCPNPPPGLVVMGIARGEISEEEKTTESVNGVHILTVMPLDGLQVRLVCGHTAV